MKTTVLIPCYNRPDYLWQVLNDLMATPQVRAGMPVVLACDGGPQATVQDNIALAIKARIPNLRCIVRPDNFGTGRNVYEAKRYLFEECQCESVFYLEDDIRVSPHIITLLTNLQRWLSANYTNACVVGSSLFCDQTSEEKLTNSAIVSDCGYSIANHMMTRECWLLSRPWLADYVRQFLQCDYNARDSKRIHAWMKAQSEKLLGYELGAKTFPVHWKIKDHFQSAPSTSQDAVTVLAFRLAGFSHVVTLTNRALHIGKIGLHSTSEIWEREYGKTTLDIYDEDNTRTYFRPTPQTIQQ